jgi:hypothetical protein
MPVYAQVDAGVIGGVPFNHFILDNRAGGRGSYSEVISAPRRYTVGPVVEFRLRGPIGFEAGALYKRFGFDSASWTGIPIGPIIYVNSYTTGNSLEFPLLAKAHLRLVPGVNWFVSGGVSLRRLFGITETGQRISRPIVPQQGQVEVTNYQTSSPEGLSRRTSVGVTLGAGLEFRTGPLRLSPGVRLTRWDTERTSSMPATSRLAQTQTEVLVSVAYAGGRTDEAASLPCCIEVGLLAGVPLLPTYEVQLAQVTPAMFVDAPTRRFAAGALVEWRFHSRLSLEGSFLVRRFGYMETTIYPGFSYSESIAGHLWEVPLLFKWRAARIRSFTFVTGGGAAFRRVSNVDQVTHWAGMAPNVNPNPYITKDTPLGVALSGGVEFRAGAIRLRPELRYLRFERPMYVSSIAMGRQDSLHLLLGAAWITGRR